MIPNVKACRTIIYFKLIKCITDKNIQFYIEATLWILLQLTKKECWENLQVVFIVKIAFPLGKRNKWDLSLVSKDKISWTSWSKCCQLGTPSLRNDHYNFSVKPNNRSSSSSNRDGGRETKPRGREAHPNQKHSKSLHWLSCFSPV